MGKSTFFGFRSIRLLAIMILFGIPVLRAQEAIRSPGHDAEDSRNPSFFDNDGLEPFPCKISGFLEARAGTRLWSNRYEKTTTLAEARLNAGVEKGWGATLFRFSGDVVYDQVTDYHKIDLDEGEGWFDMREAFLSVAPHDRVRITAGRQILSWGSGDLLFINDLFPKDWRSFYIGRDEAYLRAPSDAVYACVFGEGIRFEAVYTPRFDADRFIDGRRLSYWNPSLGRRAGRDALLRADYPDQWFRDDEIAMRVSRDFSGYEAALYGYQGFWKYPAGETPAMGRAFFPDLCVLGAGLDGPFAGGTGSIETGYYYSKEDGSGRDPYVPNSELRFLAGLEKELFPAFEATIQYYFEWMMDYGAYRRTLPANWNRRDELRHVFSLRLTQYLMDRKVALSMVSLCSPSDRDAYARPLIRYQLAEDVSMEFGANLWIGKDNHTFIGQHERNINVFAGLRYSF
ncbi:MAG: hypothetical protein ABIK28_09235 [Planctomycetota bacterium]